MEAQWALLLLSFTIIVKGDDIAQMKLYYENFTVADTNTICSYFRNVSNVSEACVEQLEIVCENTTLLMTMLDASSKFPYAGMGYGTRMDYGNYDQCMSIDHNYEKGRILGEHCTPGLVIPDFSNLSDSSSFFMLAVCRPNGCSAKDYNTILLQVISLPITTDYGLFQDMGCRTVESNTSFAAGDIITLTIFSITILLMLVSTIYDVYLYRCNLKSSHPLLIAFSVLSNGRKLLHISRKSSSKEQIEIFHGIRVISMMWIVAGHGMIMWLYVSVTNAEKVATWTKEMYSLYITTAPLAVDTFFFMSGFLLAFQYFKGKTRTLKQQVLSIPSIILHRYLRLTPAMLMIYLVTITIFIHMGSGPVWNLFNQATIDTCKTQWLRFFLYFQNYYETNDICLVQTWYLSADMQLFLLAPIILIPLSLQLKKMGLKIVMVELLILNIFWTILPLTTKLLYEDFSTKHTFDTHARFINYYIGIMLGLFMRVKIDKPFLYMLSEGYRSLVNLITWPVIILGMLATVICYQDEQLHHGYNSNAVFNSLMRPAWCTGLSWITYSCYHGHGGKEDATNHIKEIASNAIELLLLPKKSRQLYENEYNFYRKWRINMQIRELPMIVGTLAYFNRLVNSILCRPIFQVLGRLTYCIYLVHMTVIMYYASTTRTKWYFNDYQAFYQFCGHYIVSVIVATFWTLAFESPLITIEKYLLGAPRKYKEPNPPQNGTSEKQPTGVV